MDLSKLPRMGQSSEAAPPPPGVDQHKQPPLPPAAEGGQLRVSLQYSATSEQAAMGPESFINVVVGLLIIYMGWPFFDYLIHLATGRPFNYPVTDATGPVPYTSSIFFWPNMGASLFGVALIAYGLLGRIRNLGISWIVLLLLALAAMVNIYAVVAAINVVGLQVLQSLCAAFGIYLGLYQWSRVRALSAMSA
jgi:hypothetical protein